jgi:hypothetical protein
LKRSGFQIVFWVSVEMQQLIRWFLPRFGADTRDLVISIFVVDDGSNLPMLSAETETILACVRCLQTGSVVRRDDALRLLVQNPAMWLK